MSFPTKRQLERMIDTVTAAAREEISGNASGGGMFARGLSGEGYAGGYLQALHDVDAALRGISPSNSRYASAWDEARRVVARR